MCGRFYVDDDTMREIERIARKIDRQRAKTGEVFPAQPALVIQALQGELEAHVKQWGYERTGTKSVIFNVRSETVQQRPMFDRDFEIHRCVVPAGKFFEWKKSGEKEKEQYEFYDPAGILYMAGIYHRDPSGDRFAVLTQKAQGYMEGIHDRMPLVLTADEISEWLFSKEKAVKILEGSYVPLCSRKNAEEKRDNTKNAGTFGACTGYEQLKLF